MDYTEDQMRKQVYLLVVKARSEGLTKDEAEEYNRLIKEINMVKKIGRCAYCGDPILLFRRVTLTLIDGKKYHSGCAKIKEKEEAL